MQCKAKAKSTGKRCTRTTMRNMEVCYVHGGPSLKGLASATLKTGRYSKHLPTQLAADYQHALNDTELISLRDDIALVESRINELLNRISEEKPDLLWDDLRKAHDKMMQSARSRDTGQVAYYMGRMGDLIESGIAYTDTWKQISALIDQRRKLAESERRRLVDMQQMITSEQAMTLITALVSSVKEHVTDRSALQAIQSDITQFIGMGTGKRSSA